MRFFCYNQMLLVKNRRRIGPVLLFFSFPIFASICEYLFIGTAVMVCFEPSGCPWLPTCCSYFPPFTLCCFESLEYIKFDQNSTISNLIYFYKFEIYKPVFPYLPHPSYLLPLIVDLFLASNLLVRYDFPFHLM